MGISSTDRLTLDVEGFFRDHAGRLGLDAEALEVRYVLNRGGFVNHSFRISDGRESLHLKLAVSPEAQAALDRWHDLRVDLGRYRAPPVLDRVRVGRLRGLLFPSLSGASPPASADVVGTVLDRIRGLWSDRGIASGLPKRDGLTGEAFYLDTYDDRFREDLRGIRAEPPGFLAAADLEFMTSEVRRLRAAVRAEPAFAEVLVSPVHGDLWVDNLLWNGDGTWYVLDWDELQIGDPAMDVAMLTGPTPEDPTPLKHADAVRGVLGPGMSARLPVLGRASLLDWVVDPVADWVEAAVLPPDRAAAVRREKEDVHCRALALYRSLYGGG